MSELILQAKSLVPTIKETIVLVNEYNRAKEQFMNESTVKEGTFKEYLESTNDPKMSRIEQNIIQFLEKMTNDDIFIIESIMYIGSEERDPQEYLMRRKREYEEEFGLGAFDESEGDIFDSPEKKISEHMIHLKRIRTNNKHLAIDSMLEKKSLPKYLERGLKILGLNK